MYVHRRCALQGQEIDFKKKAHGYCGICGNQGTVYYVVGTLDHYLQKRQGVTYSITGGTKEPVNVTEALSYDEITPSKGALEGDLTEDIEAIREATTEAETVVIDAVLVDKREPDKTPLDGVKLYDTKDVQALKDAVAEATEQPLEAKPEVKEPLQKEPPEETAQDAESEPTEEEVAAESPEPEVEAVKPTSEILSGDIDIGPMTDEIEAQNAEIARLEAELEALRN